MRYVLVNMLFACAALMHITGCERGVDDSKNTAASYENDQERLKLACRRDEGLHKKEFITLLPIDRNQALDKIRACEPSLLDQEFVKLVASASIERYSEIIASKKSSDSEKIVAIDLIKKYDSSAGEKYKKLKESLEGKRSAAQKREEAKRDKAIEQLLQSRQSESSQSHTAAPYSIAGHDDKYSKITRECFAQAGVPIDIPDYQISELQLDKLTVCAERKIRNRQ